MTSLVLNFHNLKIFTSMHALNFRHNYMIQNPKRKKMYNCVMFY